MADMRAKELQVTKALTVSDVLYPLVPLLRGLASQKPHSHTMFDAEGGNGMIVFCEVVVAIIIAAL